MNSEIHFGTVLWFDDRLGFGAARATSGEYAYIHYKDITSAAHRTLGGGQAIAFNKRLTNEGLRFSNIRIVGLSACPWALVRGSLPRLLMKWLHRRGSVRYMWRIVDGVPIVNMIRYYLLVTPLFELYLHQFTNDDEPLMHDHPWSFISVMLEGAYIEHFEDGDCRHRAKWSVSIRNADQRHRVEVPEACRGSTVTLLVAGRRRRSWYFWDMRSRRRLTPHEYGEERGATLNTFTDFTIVGSVFPRVIGGTDTPIVRRTDS